MRSAFLLPLAPLALSWGARAEEPVLAKTDPPPIVASSGIDVSFKLEPGLAIPLTAPQSEVFGLGVGQSVKALFGLTSWLDIGPTASFLLLSAQEPGTESGVAWGFGGGLRLKTPHTSEAFWGISPWLDADALYVRTGVLDRPGFSVGIGASVPIGEDRTFWVGPFARYQHVIQIDRDGFDNHDAKVLLLGLTFEAGTGVERQRTEPEARTVEKVVEKEVVREVVKEVTREVFSCPDSDGDTIPDSIDHCPDVKGTLEQSGCPKYEKIVVKRDKLELKEKLFFEWDKARLEAASFPVLDEVVSALKENKSFKVQIEGHTDSTGGEQHNQSLSERRAVAVLDYLVTHGVPSTRLVSMGFASTVPLQSNATAAGRERNRRVEFLVSYIVVPTESAK
jgi:outer membrane protein OmpA-like peptidoglycan-associated protein